jgi:hypothetical protein
MRLLEKIFGNKKPKYASFGELVKNAKCPEDLGIKPIKESALSAAMRIQPPMPGVIIPISYCCHTVLKYTVGLIIPYCPKCGKPYYERKFG